MVLSAPTRFNSCNNVVINATTVEEERGCLPVQLTQRSSSPIIDTHRGRSVSIFESERKSCTLSPTLTTLTSPTLQRVPLTATTFPISLRIRQVRSIAQLSRYLPRTHRFPQTLNSPIPNRWALPWKFTTNSNICNEGLVA